MECPERKNMKKYKICLVLLVLTMQFGLAADVNKIIKNIQKTYDKLDNLSAVFSQIEIYKLTGSQNETTGRIFIKDGEKYRFESEDQVIVTDGKTVWTYNAISRQLLIDHVRKNSGALLPRDMLFKYPKTHFATLLKEENIDNDIYYTVRLDPKEGIKGFIKNIKIRVKKENWLVDEIETTSQNGSTSLFKITEINTKKNLEDILFIYQPPEGAQVVDMRK
jgi:outer membrane lipoprotein carrier protein